MVEIGKELLKTIFILIDTTGVVYYSNIKNKNMTKEYLKKFKIKEILNTNDFIKKEIGDYIITVDKLSIEEKLFWVVTIEKENSYLIYRDFSTDLYNRNYWEHIKNGIVKLHGDMFCSIIIIDIDNLKERNDLYGHIEGDRAIKIVGEANKNSVRENDIPIHYGGDEYIIILPNTSKSSLKKVIERIRNEIRKKSADEKIKIEVSVGAACSDRSNDLESLLQSADKKMYFEKRGKKGSM